MNICKFPLASTQVHQLLHLSSSFSIELIVCCSPILGYNRNMTTVNDGNFGQR